MNRVYFSIVVLFSAWCAKSEVKIIDLSSFVDGNLEYFQKSHPFDHYFDGKLISQKILMDSGSYFNVKFKKVSGISRIGKISQIIDIENEFNSISGQLSAPHATLFVGRVNFVEGSSYMSFNNVSIELSSPKFGVVIILKPNDNFCELSLSIEFDIFNAYIDKGNDRVQILNAFRSTFVAYVNQRMRNLVLARHQGRCVSQPAFLLLRKGLGKLSTRTFEEIIDDSATIETKQEL